ncbi:MAG: ABC transporter permease [Bacteroidota bacterium]
MFKNYLKVSLRALLKHKVYALLNVLGLTIGLTCSIIIFLFVYDETSYDQFHEKANRIQRLACIYYLPNEAGSEVNASMGPVVGPQMVEDYPEILQVVRLRVQGSKVIQKPGTDDRLFETLYIADSNFFDLFTFPLIDGDEETALVEPFTMVISQDAAQKYFGNLDVIGKTLNLPEDSIQYSITGVFDELPSNSHLQFDFVASMQTLYSLNTYMNGWWNFNTYSYVEVAEHTNMEALTEKVKLISRNYIADQEDGSGYRQEYFFQPIKDIHLNSDLRYEISANGKASYVYIFMVVGIFILIIACINFMNLATARSAMRAKEVGLRKVVGAYRRQLIAQFLSESIIITFISLILSLITAYFGLGIVNDFTGKSLAMDFAAQPILAAGILIITLLVGALSGSYPALFLSSFKPVQTLKGSFKSNRKGNILRKVLVIFQFTISVVLITGTVVVFNQLNYMRAKDLGFDKDRTIVIPTRYVNNALANFGLLKDELKGYSEIKGASLSSRVPGRDMANNVVRLGWDESAEWSDMRYLAVDYDFVLGYGLKMLAGRAFEEERGTDVNEAFILNESGMRRLGWTDPEEAIGKPLRWQRRRGYVIGVVEDFHFMSVNRAIEPFIMVMMGERTPGYLSVKLSGDQYEEGIALVRDKYKEIMPYGVFEYEFLDQEYDRQYQADQRFMGIFGFFTIVAILVACLGLYGLASFTAELKVKEIGIRKVLGASVKQLIVMMSTEFSKLVLIAIIISVPLAYWGLSAWLESFPYKTVLTWWVFVLSGVMAILIAWFTISFQSVKAAMVNPVESLAQE